VLGFDQVHLAAKPGEGLRELAADRTGPNDAQAPRQLGQAEDGLVRQIACLCQAWDRRRRGAGARGDDGLLEAQGLPRNIDRLGSREPAFAEEDVHAQVAKAPG